MAKFRFKLQGLLRLREAREKELRAEISAVQVLCREKEADILGTDARKVEWSKHYDSVLRSGQGLQRLAWVDRHLESLIRYREQLLIALDVLQRKKNDLMNEYQAAKRDLEAVKRLQEKRKNEFFTELRMKEQKEADETATLRRARERGDHAY